MLKSPVTVPWPEPELQWLAPDEYYAANRGIPSTSEVG